MKEYRKKILTVLTAICLAFGSSTLYGQIFMIDEDEYLRSGHLDDNFGLVVPAYNLTIDQYLPLGSGTAWLVALGGAYLLCKKRKHDDE